VGEEWSRYPPLGGIDEMKDSYLGWLDDVLASNAAGLAIEATPGSKQAISAMVLLAVNSALRRNWSSCEEPPVVLVPNPHYGTYPPAVMYANADICFYDPAEDVVAAIEKAIRGSTSVVAAVILCNPGNPAGEVIDRHAQRKIVQLVRDAGAVLIVDECYIDLVCEPSSVSALSTLGSACNDVVVLHTLSKRSGAPGLRSGFVAGCNTLVAEYASYNRSCGVSLSLPICRVSACLWRDRENARLLRDRVDRAWDLADTVLSTLKQYRRATAGFFIWLSVDNDEVAARELWRDQSILTMPGTYLGRSDSEGQNPGSGHLRISLCLPKSELEPMLAGVSTYIRGN